MRITKGIIKQGGIQSPGWLFRGGLLVWIAVIVCLSSVPPVGRDALTHHLRVPKLYLDNGGMVELPSISFSYYPMNLDLLYLLPLHLCDVSLFLAPVVLLTGNRRLYELLYFWGLGGALHPPLDLLWTVEQLENMAELEVAHHA